MLLADVAVASGEMIARIRAFPMAGSAGDLRALAALRDAVDAALVVGVQAFDAAGLAACDAEPSTGVWLSNQCGMTGREARATAGLARRLARCPLTQKAWLEGELPGGKARVVAANVKPRTAVVWRDHEAETLASIAELSIRDSATVLQRWAQRAEALLDDEPEPPARDPQTLYASVTLDGRLALNGDLDGATGALVDRALRAATTADIDGQRRSPATRRADALGEIAQFYLSHYRRLDDTATVPRRDRPHISVISDERDGTTRTLNGLVIDRADADALLYDARIQRLTADARKAILNYGAEIDGIPVKLYRAVALRDRTCRWAGCTRPAWQCHVHHVTERNARGETSLANCLLLCSFHHHRGVHNPDIELTLGTDGVLTIHNRTTGRSTTTYPHDQLPRAG